MKTQRNTAQKKVIMQALMQADHPTATELYDSVHRINEHISKATVFRVLSQFADNGEIRRLSIRGCDERYDAAMHPHAHLRCVCCGRVYDVMAKELEGVFGCTDIQGNEIYSAEIEFAGRCAHCVNARNNIN